MTSNVLAFSLSSGFGKNSRPLDGRSIFGSFVLLSHWLGVRASPHSFTYKNTLKTVYNEHFLPLGPAEKQVFALFSPHWFFYDFENNN
jgi:hypothetical protein